MKVTLINPKFNPTIWDLAGLKAFSNHVFSTTPLGLATVAALTPSHWDVEIIDENVEPINYDLESDLIGITAFSVQYNRAIEIAAKFRKKGKPVVFGGPYCTLFPEIFEGKGDFRVCGEAEENWPKFLNDFEKGIAKEYYEAPPHVDVTKSPTPRYDLLKTDKYYMHSLQTSRGCPYQCEFCDIIIMDGRKPRTKTVEQVVAEIDHCVRQGAKNIVFGDANFIGNLPYAKKLLTALKQYSEENNYPVEFSCELTINVAHHPDLLQLFYDANFYSLFVGIESVRTESLIESKKLQNTRKSIIDDIARIHSYHLSVVAGMIVGFDSDDTDIFKEQYDFLTELAIPFTTCGALIALPKTPLEKRLIEEGRLLHSDFSSANGHGSADCINFIPKKMTAEELGKGYEWLTRALYQYETYGARVVKMLSRFQNRVKAHKRAPIFSRYYIKIISRVLGHYFITTNTKRIKFFWKTFWGVLTNGPFSMSKWFEFLRWMAVHKCFHEYITETQGDPEGVDPNKPPFPPINRTKETPAEEKQEEPIEV